MRMTSNLIRKKTSTLPLKRTMINKGAKNNERIYAIISESIEVFVSPPRRKVNGTQEIAGGTAAMITNPDR